ncbi:hypothetical protein SAMN04487926_12230 [Paraburkholderia steynii]|uniref:Uncharacterized protein n=1 Tax=Paraburkholderia steynii TaxID=1245441 RepID=A0A7Z7FJY9_9BURK|nr:hypothetical protein [Paraburkholderia steynii]SDI70087.1 hypothetical protein SAMN04487926_12230 [Paraburkholderia steynii]
MSSRSKSIAHEIIAAFSDVDKEISKIYVKKFENLFREHEPKHDSHHYKFVDLRKERDFEKIPKGRGFYLIVGDCIPNRPGPNKCNLVINGYPVLYRGQAHNVKERIESHLDNRRYVETNTKKKKDVWTRCIKLDEGDGAGGINIRDPEHEANYWAVLILPMQNSTTVLRQYAEWGFDRVFGKPIASNERKQAPEELVNELAMEQSEA